MAELSIFATSKNVLGESPFWHPIRKSLFWVDIEPGILHEQKLDSERTDTWKVGKKIAVILSQTGSQLLIGAQDGISRFDLSTGELNLIIPLTVGQPSLRCNDGSFDSKGNIWVGNMDMQGTEGLGNLYRIGVEGKTNKVLDGLTIPNGLVFSLDHERMYFIDTPTRTVKSYLVDSNANFSFEKIVITVPENMGMPDGMTIDNQGMLWIALYGGASVSRWNPINGALLETIAIPALQVTSCCFVGEDLDELMVTTARENMTDAQLGMYPESGQVFRVKKIGVAGVKMLSHIPSTTFFQ